MATGPHFQQGAPKDLTCQQSSDDVHAAVNDGIQEFMLEKKTVSTIGSNNIISVEGTGMCVMFLIRSDHMKREWSIKKGS